MSEGGKLHGQVKEVADSVGMSGDLRKLIPVARSAGLKAFALPQSRFQEGDHESSRQIGRQGDLRLRGGGPYPVRSTL